MLRFILIISFCLPTVILAELKVEEFTARMNEIDKHPNNEVRNKLKSEVKEVVAVSFIDLSDEQKLKLNKLKEDYKKSCNDWENKNGKRFSEVLAETKRLRFSSGEGVDEAYRKMHELKCKIAQTRPKITKEQIVNILTSAQKVEYNNHLEILNFWYGGHGEKVRIMMLIKAGASPENAINMFLDFSEKMNNYKKKARQGEKLKKPDFHKDYLDPLKRNKAKQGPPVVFKKYFS